MKYLKGLALILLTFGIPAITFAQQAEGYYGTSYGLYLQRQGTDGHAFILHNAKFNNTTSTYQAFNTHPNFGLGRCCLVIQRTPPFLQTPL